MSERRLHLVPQLDTPIADVPTVETQFFIHRDTETSAVVFVSHPNTVPGRSMQRQYKFPLPHRGSYEAGGAIRSVEFTQGADSFGLRSIEVDPLRLLAGYRFYEGARNDVARLTHEDLVEGLIAGADTVHVDLPGSQQTVWKRLFDMHMSYREAADALLTDKK